MIKNNSNSQLAAIISSIDRDQTVAKSMIAAMHYADIADLIDNLTGDNRVKLISFIINNFPKIVSRILTELSPHIREELIGLASDLEILFKHTDANQVTYIIQDVSSLARKKILDSLNPELSSAISELLSYPENSAGRIMRKEFAAVSASWNITQVVEFLKSNKSIDDFNEVFVLNENSKPVGTINLSSIIRASGDEIVSSLMKKYVEYAYDYMNQEEVSYICRQYSLMSVAVVDRNEKMIGVIASDDVVELVEDEVETDLMKMAGIIDVSYINEAFFDTIKNRFPWLFINLIAATLTSLVIIFFESTIKQIVALAAIMPIVASLGGNAGTQTLTVIVRAIANRELTSKNYYKTIFKEMFTAIFTGIAIAILGVVIITLLYHEIYLSLIFALAVVINFALAGFLGSFIPIFLFRFGIDPATASVVFLTALTDIIGFFAFLGLSKYFLL